ncbi:MAG TPA: tetratricopeptide repeat protein [Terriglobales bacterium]|nr:tetratricopeptide repeat protein [Terriglobales bacterium]
MEDGTHTSGDAKPLWKPAQVYVMAGICLLIGVAVGYFVRGSASLAPQVVSSETAMQSPQAAPAAAQQRMPTLEEMKQMADKQAEPLLAKLKTDPNNADLLNQIGTLYRLTHQFQTAIDYYQKSLAINPKNVGARTDMASCMYYLGDVDGALAELNKSLTYDPKHAGTLINLGIIKWKGKNDVDGAIAAWQKLLKLNPDFEDKEMVEHLIMEAKQQKNGTPITGVKG